MKLNCLIVDDEPLARKGMEEYVREVPFLLLAGSCESAMKAASILKEQPVDLMLLDIHMPKAIQIAFRDGDLVVKGLSFNLIEINRASICHSWLLP